MVAKIVEDGPETSAGDFSRCGGSCSARGRWWEGQVGSSFAAWVLSKLEECHDWKNGARLGEADHPGPSGGGSRATARKRNEREDEDDIDDGGGLAAMLRPMIERLIIETLAEILGGGSLKGMIAGMLAGGQPAKGAGKRWNKRRKVQDADGGGGLVKDKGQGKDNAHPQGKGKNNGGENPKGKGKNTGEIPKGKGKDTGGEIPKGKGQNTSVTPEGKNQLAGGDEEAGLR